jgi:PAS fold
VRLTGDGIVVLGADGRVRLWNRAMERLMGVPAGGALGRSYDDLLAGRDSTGATLDELLVGVGPDSPNVSAEVQMASIERAKADFVAAVSHESRTPMTMAATAPGSACTSLASWPAPWAARWTPPAPPAALRSPCAFPWPARPPTRRARSAAQASSVRAASRAWRPAVWMTAGSM